MRAGAEDGTTLRSSHLRLYSAEICAVNRTNQCTHNLQIWMDGSGVGGVRGQRWGEGGSQCVPLTEYFPDGHFVPPFINPTATNKIQCINRSRGSLGRLSRFFCSADLFLSHKQHSGKGFGWKRREKAMRLLCCVALTIVLSCFEGLRVCSAATQCDSVKK